MQVNCSFWSASFFCLDAATPPLSLSLSLPPSLHHKTHLTALILQLALCTSLSHTAIPFHTTLEYCRHLPSRLDVRKGENVLCLLLATCRLLLLASMMGQLSVTSRREI